MRKVIVGAFVSMDGVMQAPGGPEEDPTGGFEHGGWVAPLADIDPVFGEEVGKLFGEPFDLLLGRRTIVHATYVRDGEVRTTTVGGAQEPSPAELKRREKLKQEAS